jgi:hypothetical protein
LKSDDVRIVTGIALVLLLAGPLSAQPPGILEPSTRASAQRTPSDTRVEELERRVRELEARLLALEGGAPKPGLAAAPADPATTEATLKPVAMPDDGETTSQTGPISGYMDFHLNKPQGEDPLLDFHRFVLLFNHSFTDRLRFVGELEVEHALVEGLESAGELELEQAYLDFRVKPFFNIRAGMLLAPVGIINERHEPPAFFGVERPFVDTVIIPTTWFDAGAGVHGAFGSGWQYRAFVMAPLDATRITADDGLAEARQKGFLSNVRDVALTSRVEYAGFPGLNLGASFWRGKTGFNLPRVDSSIGVYEFDGRYHHGPLAVRGEFAQVVLRGAGDLNDFQQRASGVNPNIASQMRGFYIEPAIRPLPRLRADIAAFMRYENFDTQYRMPPGVQALKQFDRTAWVFGGSYFPDPDVVFKVDYTIVRNRSSLFRSIDGFNVGLGWWF